VEVVLVEFENVPEEAVHKIEFAEPPKAPDKFTMEPAQIV
jgi:hypothetical protein